VANPHCSYSLDESSWCLSSHRAV